MACKSKLQHLIPRYILLKVGLGMWRRRHVDDAWCPSRMCCHRGLSQLFTTTQYYLLHKFANPYITDVLFAINRACSDLWRWGCAAAGDEAIVPHKGNKARPLRQIIPRKPHSDRQSLFFICADGKAEVFLAVRQNWKAEYAVATLCWVCMRNRALCVATFGTASVIDGNWEGAVAIGAIYRTITSDRRVPDYGLHGVLGVLLCSINGTQYLVVQLTGKAPATVARTMLQLVLDEARLGARTCTRASLNNDKANSKGKVRMECAAAIHFMRNRGWEKIMDACLQQPSVRQHQVGGKSSVSVRKTWWDNCASMCVYVWRSAWFSGADLGRLQNHSMAMGNAHNDLQWGKLLWTHLWIDRMYYFAKKWRILSKFPCFTMEGSHRSLKRMLRNSGGLSLLRGRLGVQVVVDNGTIDDSLWSHGWDATKMPQH